MTTKELLATYAEGAGLSPLPRPFPRKGSLKERLAQAGYLMAPMAGVSNSAYRLIARCGGAGLAYTEMVSVAGLHFNSQKTWDLVLPDEAEPDIAVQLFGSKPEQFREAAATVSEHLGNRLVLIDINMACPAPKVTRKGEGSALMENPELAQELVRACREETDAPVTAKIRKGFAKGEETAPEFARALEQAGVSAIAAHGRTAHQLYRGQASWEAIKHVVEAISVPVIGSGDVMSGETARTMREQTGVTAVMVARGSYGDPWIFHDAQTGNNRTPSVEERLNAFALQLRLLQATGAHLARARSLAGWYIKGFPHAGAWRERTMHCESLDDYLDYIDQLKASYGAYGEEVD